MENKVFKVRISAMSKKDSKTFKSDRLTAYIEAANDDEEVKMIDFGLNRYTSEDSETFFIIKTSQQVNLYTDSTNNFVPLDGTKGGELVKTKDGQTVKINVIKGENKGKEFYRLQAILDDSNALEQIESKNPFDD
nr:MAG TPA: hypothetical protein [Caudoviricetes sp.]